MLLLISFVIVGCRAGSAARPAPLELRIGVGAPESNRARALEAIGALLFSESLLVRQTDGRTIPGLATGWRWEDDGRTLRLTLKDGVRLHDGSVMSSDLVVQLLQKSLDVDERQLGFAFVTAVTAPDPRTVVVALSRPDFFLLPELTALRIVRPDAPEIATGPFQIVKRTPVFETVRFDAYHGGAPAMERASVVTYDTQRAAWAALLRGEVDALQEVSRETVEFATRATDVRTYPSMQSFYIALVFNQKHPLLAKKEIRRALNEGIDTEAIVRLAMRGHAQVAEDPIWPLHWAYAPPEAPHRYDPAAAQIRLDAAGLPRKAVRTGRGNAARFRIRCLFWSDEPMYERIALMIQRQLFDLGIDLVLEPANLKQLIARANAGDFDTLLPRANAGRSLDFTYRFWHSWDQPGRAMWQSGYSGADELLDQLRASTTDEEARSVIAALGRRFRQDVPAVFIAWPQVTRAIAATFDVGRLNEQDPFARIWEWRPSEVSGR